MPKLKSIIPKIRNHIYYLSLTFLGMAMALITTIIVTRSLSIIDRSDYGIATVALMQILMVSQLGLPGAFGITGPAPFRKFGFRKFLKLYLLRTFWFLLTILIFTAFYQGNFLVAMFAFLNALLLIPSQWAMNALHFFSRRLKKKKGYLLDMLHRAKGKDEKRGNEMVSVL